MDSNTRDIPLTCGRVAIVDSADYEWLSQWKWHWDRKYAVRYQHLHMENGKAIKQRISMARLITSCPEGFQVDHINGDKLDNRRSNLRVCKNIENSYNRGLRRDNTTGIKGVTWHKRIKKHQVRVAANGKRHHLGYFDDLSEAERVYWEAAKRFQGEFARLR